MSPVHGSADDSLNSPLFLLVQNAVLRLHQGQLLAVPGLPQRPAGLNAALLEQSLGVVLLGNDDRSRLDITGDLHPEHSQHVAHVIV